MKHICIDARLYGPKNTGIGRYVQNLLQALGKLPDFKKYHFTLLVYPQDLALIKNELGTGFDYYAVTTPHYSLSEQIILPFILYRLKPDLVHIPHFNKPIFYFGKTVITIHDLIKHFSTGKDTTTKSPLFYWPKYFAYLILTKLVIEHNKIIVPTNFWRDYLLAHFHLKAKNIITTYEAVDPNYLLPPTTSPKHANYLLYSGNLYPHKNISVVFEALKINPKLSLKIISKPNIFLTRTKNLAQKLGLTQQVEFMGFVANAEFIKLHRLALAYVFPSFMEGFGLPGLEAQALGCPVICANASCFPEVYGHSVLYFDPKSPSDLVKKINELSDSPDLRQKLITKGREQVKLYSWSKTATQTLAYYEHAITS